MTLFRNPDPQSEVIKDQDLNLPMVGMVVTISPSFNLYKIVVFPAASRPTEKRKKKSSNSRQNYQWNLGLTHQNPHLFLAKKSTKQTRNGQPHNLCAKFSQKLQKFVSKIDKREISKYETDWEFPDLWSREICRFSVKMPIWRVFQGDKKPKNNEFLSMCRCSQSTPLPTQL